MPKITEDNETRNKTEQEWLTSLFKGETPPQGTYIPQAEKCLHMTVHKYT